VVADSPRYLEMNGAATATTGPTWTVVSIHAKHAGFVWASLHRLGVPESDRPDLLQEVFVVVHRRLDSFDGSSAMTTWLYGICLRVVLGWRRHRRRHPEVPTAYPDADARDAGRTPEEHAVAAQARATVARALEALDPEKRAVFVMFELEELSCVEIAAMIGVPVGTVYSRLHAARALFARAATALRDEAGGGP
jgi:RNA polymerase sigma-70 factor (ECF subfamily)